ncbi:MAG: GldG family protein, partial [Leptospiraceae bacterium]|nr:GldG family protein [Leptospiraceae bacterium]
MISFFQKYEKNRTYLISQIILLFALVNLFFSDFNCRRDLSKENRFDLTESTEKIINNLTEKLYIDAFYSEDVPGMHKARLNLAKEVLKEIASVNRKKVELRFYNPDSNESARKKASEAGIRSFPLEKLERGSAEVKQAYFGIRLTLGAKSEVIPVAYAAENIEYQVLSTLKKMTRKPGSSNMAIIKANGAHTAPSSTLGASPNKDTFGLIIHELFAKEYGQPEEININEEPVSEEFNIVLSVGAPDLNEKGQYHLDQFLMRGGGLIVFAKTMDFTLPSRQRGMPSFGGEGIATAHPNAEKLNNFLKKYGVEVKTDLIMEPEFSMVTSSFIQVQPGVFVPYHYPLWPVPTHDSKQLSKD